MKEVVSEKEHLDDETRADLLSKFDEALEQVADVKEQVQAVDTISELRQAKNSVIDLLREFRVRLAVGVQVAEKNAKWKAVGRVFTLWDSRLLRYVENNDVNEDLQEKIEDYHARLEALKGDVSEYTATVEELRADGLTDEEKETLKDTEKAIQDRARELRDLLKEIVGDIKAEHPNLRADAPIEEELEDDEENEEDDDDVPQIPEDEDSELEGSQ